LFRKIELFFLHTKGQLHQIATDFYGIQLTIDELNSEPFNKEEGINCNLGNFKQEQCGNQLDTNDD